MAKAKAANTLVKFTAAALKAQGMSDPNAAFLLEHPEDLGRTKEGKAPASIWQLPEVQELGDIAGACSGALYQSDWGRAYAKPTRLLGRLQGLEDLLKVGPPSFDKLGAYIGPLSKCSSATSSLIGKDHADFRTRSAAAWPRQLCTRLAEMTIQHCAQRKLAPRWGVEGNFEAKRRSQGEGEELARKRRKITPWELDEIRRGGVWPQERT